MTRQEAVELLDRYLAAMGADVAALYDDTERQMMITALLAESEFPEGQDRTLTRYVHYVLTGQGGVN